MKSVYDGAIFKEDMDMLLHTLTKRTISKKQIWNGNGYVPITFVDTSDSSAPAADISHIFYTDTIFNNILFDLELTESISLPSGKGDIMGRIRYKNEFGPHKYEFRLSDDLKYDDCTAGNIVLQYRTSPLLPFAKTVVKSFVKSEIVKNSPPSDYQLMQEEIDYWKEKTKVPLMQLIEKLMIEQNALRFHQIILNTSYRTKLFSQYNLSNNYQEGTVCHD